LKNDGTSTAGPAKAAHSQTTPLQSVAENDANGIWQTKRHGSVRCGKARTVMPNAEYIKYLEQKRWDRYQNDKNRPDWAGSCIVCVRRQVPGASQSNTHLTSPWLWQFRAWQIQAKKAERDSGGMEIKITATRVKTEQVNPYLLVVWSGRHDIVQHNWKELSHTIRSSSVGAILGRAIDFLAFCSGLLDPFTDYHVYSVENTEFVGRRSFL
jgi:hypothetical protein